MIVETVVGIRSANPAYVAELAQGLGYNSAFVNSVYGEVVVLNAINYSNEADLLKIVANTSEGKNPLTCLPFSLMVASLPLKQAPSASRSIPCCLCCTVDGECNSQTPLSLNAVTALRTNVRDL